MLSICGADCCCECKKRESCGGCVNVEGHPFGGTCIAAESIKRGGFDEFIRVKNTLIAEINALGIDNLHVQDLNLLNGCFVNLEYKLPNGQKVKLLEDNNVYWGTQIEGIKNNRCYGIVADEQYLLVSEYGNKGSLPEIILYKKR